MGESHVGKTSIIINYTDVPFSESPNLTIRVGFQVKEVNIQGQQIELQIWDSVGQEKAIQYPSNITTEHKVLISFIITDRATFSAIKHWLQDVENHIGSGPQKILIGNKVDLSGKVVSKNEAMEFVKKQNIPFF